jgi:gamma-glutamyltranspeptidase/glutathione hydrolase/leukotriene-C4 hydrolase
MNEIFNFDFNLLGGNVTRDDFKNYRARVHTDRFMIKLNDNLRIYTPPPPSSGILVAFILKLMSGIQ